MGVSLWEKSDKKGEASETRTFRERKKSPRLVKGGRWML